LGNEGRAAACEPFIVFSNVLDNKSLAQNSAPTNTCCKRENK